MKPAFLLMCYLAGNPAGQTHFANVNNCDYFKKYLDNQSIKMGKEERNYDCFCKLVTVNESTRLY